MIIETFKEILLTLNRQFPNSKSIEINIETSKENQFFFGEMVQREINKQGNFVNPPKNPIEKIKYTSIQIANLGKINVNKNDDDQNNSGGSE